MFFCWRPQGRGGKTTPSNIKGTSTQAGYYKGPIRLPVSGPQKHCPWAIAGTVMVTHIREWLAKEIVDYVVFALFKET